MKLKPPTEAEIQRVCLAYLNAVGWAVKVPAGGAKRGDHYIRLAPQGTPDILGVVPHPTRGGVMVGVEVKKPGGRLRPGQGETLDRINRCGGVGVVVTSLDDLQSALRAEGFEV